MTSTVMSPIGHWLGEEGGGSQTQKKTYLKGLVAASLGEITGRDWEMCVCVCC